MNDTQIGDFLKESVVFEDDTDDGLDVETLYGLYVSWCALDRRVPIPENAFETALQISGHRSIKENGIRIYRGLVMVGPAARDYAVNNVPLAKGAAASAAPTQSDPDDEFMPHIA